MPIIIRAVSRPLADLSPIESPILLLATLLFFTTEGGAAQPIDDYIRTHGSCQRISNSWEKEFRRPDASPFDKPWVDWQADDYTIVRSWVERCLDPWSAAPGRRQFIMGNVDSKLNYFRDDQQRRAEAKRKNEQLTERMVAEKNRVEAQKKETENLEKEKRQIALTEQKRKFEANAEERQRLSEKNGKQDILGFSPGMTLSDVSYLLQTNNLVCNHGMGFPTSPSPGALAQWVSAGENISCQSASVQVNLRFAPALDQNPLLAITMFFTSGDTVVNVAKSISDQFGKNYTEVKGDNGETTAYEWLLGEGLFLLYQSGRSQGSKELLTLYNVSIDKKNEDAAVEKEKTLHPTPRF